MVFRNCRSTVSQVCIPLSQFHHARKQQHHQKFYPRPSSLQCLQSLLDIDQDTDRTRERTGYAARNSHVDELRSLIFEAVSLAILGNADANALRYPVRTEKRQFDGKQRQSAQSAVKRRLWSLVLCFGMQRVAGGSINLTVKRHREVETY